MPDLAYVPHPITLARPLLTNLKERIPKGESRFRLGPADRAAVWDNRRSLVRG